MLFVFLVATVVFILLMRQLRKEEPDRFFAFYGDLLMKLGKPVDLVDLSQPSKLTAWIMKRGQKIYG